MKIILCIFGVVLLAKVGLCSPVHGHKYMQKRYDPMENQCEISQEARVQCGAKTFSESECALRGCCFEACEGCNASVPWCFAAKRMVRGECQVSYEEKDDCGYYGITEGECFMRDCCWRPSHLPNDPPCFHKLSIRLVDGPNADSGRVEISHDSQWGTVCDDNFGTEEANVVCRSLGYRSGIPRGYATYGQGSGPIWLDGLYCNGDEESLGDCDHNGWGRHDCSHSEDSGVDCSMEEATDPYEYTYYPSYYYSYRNGEEGTGTGGRTGFAGKPDKKRRMASGLPGKKAVKQLQQLLHKKALAKKQRALKTKKV